MDGEKMRLTIATRNAHKTREFAMLLGNSFEVNDLTTARNLPPVEETGGTFAENAILKAMAASRVIAGTVVADDSGLEVDALVGAPGVYSARYAGPEASDADNIGKLLVELGRVTSSAAKPAARFRCVLALASDGKLLGTFAGAIEGTIVSVSRGASGFGYDPIFLPQGFEQTFGELDPAMKNRISHRAAATLALRSALLARQR